MNGGPMQADIWISETFGPTVQGEGALIGRPTVFVRTGGCDYRCSWCDSLYAVLPAQRKEWTRMTPEAIFSLVRGLSPQPILITLSGGNPAMHPLEPLLDIGHAAGYTFCMETQGSLVKPWFAKLDHLTVSPKPPSSGMKTNWERLGQCLAMAWGGDCATVLKIVIFDDDDYRYARAVARRYPTLPIYLQTGNATPPQTAVFDLEGVLAKTRWLVEKVTGDGWNDVIVLPQLHTLLYGNQRGV